MSVSAQRRYFTFRNPKNNFIYEEGNDVFNVVGDAPTVKGVFYFFIKEETITISYDKGKVVFNVVGGVPTVKGVFSFFNKEETVCRM